MHKARPREPMVASRIHRTERAWADAREPALQLIWNTTTDLEVEGGGLVDHRGEVAAEVRILRCTRLGLYFQIVVQFCDCHFQVSLCCCLNSVKPARLGYADQLLVRELTDAEGREFAAIAGILDSAEWQVRGSPCRLVNEDHSGVDLTRDPLATFDVLGDDRSTQSIGRVVGELDGFLVRLHPEDQRYRSEELLIVGWV